MLEIGLQICKVCFLVGFVALVLAKYQFPFFLQYGKTLNFAHRKLGWQRYAGFTVPKKWFAHFYVLSSVLAVVNVVLFASGPLPYCVLVHSLRRLYETLYILKYNDRSRMNWSHYAVGLWFYSTLNFTILALSQDSQLSTQWHPISLLMFLAASVDQNVHHRVLASLEKYTLPTSLMFEFCCSPHYFDELIIYLSFTTYHREFLWQLAWVSVSLTISAIETRNYYLTRYKTNVPKYAIIPYLI